MKLLLATGNPAKLAVLRWLVDGLSIETLTPREVGAEPPFEEGAESVRANAELKARVWTAAYGMPALASDGGLVVPGLGDRWNPALTRRAAGEGATDTERAEHLLRLIGDLKGADRAAHMLEVVALAVPQRDGTVSVRSWEVEGEPKRVADHYTPDGLPPGFWIPGVLESVEPQTANADRGARRDEPADHWRKLRPPVRAALEALLAGTAK